METMTRPATSFPLQQTRRFHLQNQLSTALQSCTTMAQLKQIHAQMIRTGLDRCSSLLTRLVSFCALSSSLDYARLVFDQIPDPETTLCNKIIREFSRSSKPEGAMWVYEKMRINGVPLDRFSFPPLLKASVRLLALGEGREIHGVGVKMGFDADPFIQTGLVKLYALCGSVSEARQLFDRMSERDVVTWSVMIDGYAKIAHYEDALLLFEEMRQGSGVEPDEVVLVSVLSSCGRAGNLKTGKEIHAYISDKNFNLDPHLQSALVNMYASCGSMHSAHQLFDKMYPQNVVSSTAMVFGYSKIGKVETARSIFDEMPENDLVAWSAMISGYVENGQPNEALKLFSKMQLSGEKPDQVTMLSVLSACAQLGALDQGKWIHIFVDKNGFSQIMSINNALIDMYAKCGSLSNAHQVFDKMPQRNVISWTSMITGFAMHGDGESALRFFSQMKVENIMPNGVTFVGILYACSHAGLVDKGRQIFASMSHEHGIMPKREHYGCMVDLLGRANLLQEALELIRNMPFEPNVVIWGSLLGASRVHGDVKLGIFAAKMLLELDPDHDGAYVLLSNIYARESRWEDVRKVRQMMKNRGITKEPGSSWMELNSRIHEFVMGDKSHPQSNEIYEKLDEVVSKLKLVGYVPNTSTVLVDLEEEEKDEAILLHSEKLVLSFGLINMDKGSCIRIVKNLRVCDDCHSFMKLVSEVFEREIVLRDRNRFHHFRNGSCSCKDFW